MLAQRVILKTFNEIPLLAPIQQALVELKFSEPTPIQAQALPVALTGRDIVGIAQTGTGKTAAFLIPLLQRLLQSPNETALVLAPTRELVLQIESFLRDLTKFCPEMRSAPLIGGAPMPPQLRALARKPRILIATPGRLIDHLERRTANLSQSTYLVLDEADRMLDMGFAPQIERILTQVPKVRQTLLFSATWDARMDALGRKLMKNPERILISKNSQPAMTIAQRALYTTVLDKNAALVNEISTREGSIIVFARTQARTERLADYLFDKGFQVGRMHGGRSQGQRKRSLEAFREGVIRILVATDLAARGIDISTIAHVINFDLPASPEDYIHRVGRTGRAGATGDAISLITPEERGLWNAISRLLKASGAPVPKIEGSKFTEVPGVTFGNERPTKDFNRRMDRRPSGRPTEGDVRHSDRRPVEGEQRRFGSSSRGTFSKKPSFGRSERPQKSGPTSRPWEAGPRKN